MREGQKRVNVYIPEDLYSRVLNSEYNLTEAIITGLTNLLETPREDFESKADTKPLVSSENPSVSPEIIELKNSIEEYKAQVQGLNAEISRLKTVIMEAPDPFEMVKLQERNEGLLRLTQEKEERIKDLTREVERLDIFAHYFKNVEIKQIEAPAAEKVKPWWKFW